MPTGVWPVDANVFFSDADFLPSAEIIGQNVPKQKDEDGPTEHHLPGSNNNINAIVPLLTHIIDSEPTSHRKLRILPFYTKEFQKKEDYFYR